MKKIITLIIIALAVMMLASCLKKEKGGSGDLFNKVLSADEALAEAKKTDTVVFEDTEITSGKDVWESFCKKASKGRRHPFCAPITTRWTSRIFQKSFMSRKRMSIRSCTSISLSLTDISTALRHVTANWRT